MRRPAERGRRRGDHRPVAAPGRQTTRLYIGVGRQDGVRPADLVGAITGETGLRGGQIGAIDIAPRFSIVEVPAEAAREVISALQGAKIRGRRAAVRPDRA
jgi:ATP-dependent RNA helicase DeaD